MALRRTIGPPWLVEGVLTALKEAKTEWRGDRKAAERARAELAVEAERLKAKERELEEREKLLGAVVMFTDAANLSVPGVMLSSISCSPKACLWSQRDSDPLACAMPSFPSTKTGGGQTVGGDPAV